MLRILTATVAGLLVGAVAAHLLTRAAISPDGPVVRDIAGVPKISASAAARHRDARYTDVATIEQVLALPTEFTRSEALYVLAGRSDPAAVQQLIFEANRIADDHVRRGTLGILFERLAELDPQSALALTQTDYFRDLPGLRDVVWQAWGRQDLGAALSAARDEAAFFDRNRAAQALYAAFGFMGNEITDRIEAELGIRPDRSVRARFIYRMVDASAEEAVRWIEALPESRDRGEYITFLGYYLAQTDPERLDTVAGLLETSGARDALRAAAANYAVNTDPAGIIERALAAGYTDSNRRAYINAMRVLVHEDPEAAIGYFDRTDDHDMRQYIGNLIAEKLAATDPAGALAWARAADGRDKSILEGQVLQHIARHDPQYALTEALQAETFVDRAGFVENVLAQVARQDSDAVASMLDQLGSARLRNEVTGRILDNWVHSDATAAVDWALSQDDATAERLLSRVSFTLVNADIDAAIEYLPEFDPQHQRIMRRRIAVQLATEYSLAEAQAFVRKFEGQEGHAELQSAVISHVAASDLTAAKQMADQLPDAGARAIAYGAIATQYAQEDPRAAARMVATISDEDSRASASGSIASQWSSYDANAATRWVAGLPVGRARDAATIGLVANWSEPTAEHIAMLDDIVDDDLRARGKVQLAARIAQSDPERAKKFLEDPDIPEMYRDELEAYLRQSRTGF